MKRIYLLATLLLVGAFWLTSCKKTQAPKLAAPVSFDWDKGPIEIDAQVAKYPKEYQATYNNIVKAKCTQCHPLSRSLWAPYYDEATWNKVVSKMANRPGSQVTTDEVAIVTKFFVYDHAKRKAEIEKMFQDNHWEKKEPVALQ